MHMISKFLTFNKNNRRGGTYYVNYYNMQLWLEDWFPGYSFMVNTDITDNAIAVNISKVLPDDDIGNKEIHVACAKIPFVFMNIELNKSFKMLLIGRSIWITIV